MKKLAIVLAMILCFSMLTACGSGESNPEDTSTEPTSISEDTSATPTSDPDDESSSSTSQPDTSEPSTDTSSAPSATPKPSQSPSQQGGGNQTGGGSNSSSNSGNTNSQPPSTTTPPASAATPKPESTPAPTPKPTPSGPFDYPFDPDQIVAEMKSYGEGLGLTYGTGSSSGQSVTASKSYQGSTLKSGLQSAISFLLSDNFKAYGGETPTHFKIKYSGSSGSYTFTIYY